MLDGNKQLIYVGDILRIKGTLHPTKDSNKYASYRYKVINIHFQTLDVLRVFPDRGDYIEKAIYPLLFVSDPDFDERKSMMAFLLL